LRVGEAVAKVEKIETALEPHFQQLFVHAMAMPNKVDVFPELGEGGEAAGAAGGRDGGGCGGPETRQEKAVSY
jgi:hypothetical protein